MNILDTIVAHKKEEVKDRKSRGLNPPSFDPGPGRGFKKALISDPGVSIIAEVKKASPSKGLICPDFDPVALAEDYETGGARAVSVLTDEKFFQGNLAFLPQIRGKVSLPLLRKDFIIDHFQVDESAAFGADAILLIVAILDQVLLEELLAHAMESGLDALVEVHDPHEMERALAADAGLIGVNNRNLRDFSVSLETTFAIRQIMPGNIPMVSESGISSADHMKQLFEHGVTAALIGEALAASPERPSHLRRLVEAGKGA